LTCFSRVRISGSIFLALRRPDTRYETQTTKGWEHPKGRVFPTPGSVDSRSIIIDRSTPLLSFERSSLVPRAGETTLYCCCEINPNSSTTHRGFPKGGGFASCSPEGKTRSYILPARKKRYRGGAPLGGGGLNRIVR